MRQIASYARPLSSPLKAALMNDFDDVNAFLEPGMIVRHPSQPDWGMGQVQSVIDGRITVNFREQGKVVIVGSQIALVPVFDAG